MSAAFYADETGTHSISGKNAGLAVAGVGGYLSWPQDWAKFCEQWKEVLDEHNIGCFHFSEFADRKNGPRRKSWPYLGWSEEKRDTFLNSLAAIATQNTQFSFGCFFSASDYNRIIPAWYRKRPNNQPYDLCFKGFFEGLLGELKNRWILPYSAGSQVAFFFDQNTDPRWQRSVLAIFNAVERLKDTDERMGTITFAEMKRTLPLQAADMVIYRMRQVLERYYRDKITVNKPNSFDAFLAPDDKRLNILYYEDRQLKQLADLLERDKKLILKQGRD